jgi:hypothetical protein
MAARKAKAIAERGFRTVELHQREARSLRRERMERRVKRIAQRAGRTA